MEKYIPNTATGKKVAYLGISAHKDDLEMMAFDGICKGQKEYGFVGAVLTDGAGCPRANWYANITSEELVEMRSKEQRSAAELGAYEALYLFDYSSQEAKDLDKRAIEEVANMLKNYPRLKALYLHSPFDRHLTHVATLRVVLAALSTLPKDVLPEKVYGCEMWRDLDWLPEKYKVAFNLTGNLKLSRKLMNCFTSQNAVKRYDSAIISRRKSNATFYQSHEGDKTNALTFAVDLTSVAHGEIPLNMFVENVLKDFRTDIFENIK